MQRSALALCLISVLALTACGERTEAPASAATDATANAPTAEPATPAASAPAAATGSYTLTQENVDKMFEAQKRLAAAAQSDPELAEFIGQNVSRENGEQYAQRLAGNAKARGLIEQAGLSTRDYALTSELLVAALMAHGAMEAGHLKTLPEGIDPAAVEFVKQNRDELMAKLQGK
ncbi:MAG TPA: hypothetical protein VEY50_10205 [Lysobacter sp.]|nr:hypothetical protein [Lysobacter sp.]